MSTAPDAPTANDPNVVLAPASQFLEVMERNRLAMADASGIFTDDQLHQTFRVSKVHLNKLREDPAYQHAYTEQLNRFQASLAARNFELSLLGDTALANAKFYLENRAMTKENVDMTKFILSKVLPNPEQAVRIATNNQPHLSVEATIILNDRLPQYAQSLNGVPTISISDDPNLRRANS